MNYCLALDVAKGKSTVVLADEKGELLLGPEDVEHTQKQLDSLRGRIEKTCGGKPTVMMEATSVYHLTPLHYFEKLGYRTVVTNPLFTSMRKKTLRKTKTDQEDAMFLARAYFSGDYSLQTESGAPKAGLQCLFRNEVFLTGEMRPVKTKIRMLVSECFPSLEAIFPGNRLFSPSALRLMRRYPHPDLLDGKTSEEVSKTISASGRRYGLSISVAEKILEHRNDLLPSSEKRSEQCRALSSLSRIVSELEDDIAREKKKLVSECSREKFFPVFKSFPGITDFLAAAMTAELGDPTRFGNEKKLVAYCGLDPTIVQSGRSINYNGPISKRGNRYMRTILYQCIVTMLRYDAVKRQESEIGRYYKKKRSDGKHHYVATAACSTKLLREIYYRALDYSKSGIITVK